MFKTKMYSATNKPHRSLVVNNDETFQVTSLGRNVKKHSISMHLFPPIYHKILHFNTITKYYTNMINCKCYGGEHKAEQLYIYVTMC